MSFLTKIQSEYAVSPDGEADAHHNEKGLSLSQAIDSFMHYIKGKAPAAVLAATVSYAEAQKIDEEYMKEYARRVWKYGALLRRRYDKSAVSEEGEA